ncbi:MAG: GDYXXLXY domain-containing protein [bacterium JZ-2024 1]
MTPQDLRGTKWYFGIVTAQLLLVVVLAAFHQSVLLTGRRFHLKVVPADPRDLFMGRYLALAYEAETVDLRQVLLEEIDRENLGHRAVVVILREEGGLARPVVIKGGTCPPKLQANEFCLRAEALSVDAHFVRLRFDIDRYYLPEAKADEVERRLRAAWSRDEPVVAEIATHAPGSASVVRIFVRDTPLIF